MLPKTTLLQLLATPEAQRLAHSAPLDLLAQVLSLALPLIDEIHLRSVLGTVPPWLNQLLVLTNEARTATLQRGLEGAEREAARVAGAILIVAGPILQVALPIQGRVALIEGLASALRNGPAPLPQLADGVVDALRGDADAQIWSRMRVLLNEALTIKATIEAEDESSITHSPIHLPTTLSSIQATVSARRRSTISDSPIIIGNSPPAASSPTHIRTDHSPHPHTRHHRQPRHLPCRSTSDPPGE